MITEIRFKKGLGVPSSLKYAEPAVDMLNKTLYIGMTEGDDGGPDFLKIIDEEKVRSIIAESTLESNLISSGSGDNSVIFLSDNSNSAEGKNSFSGGKNAHASGEGSISLGYSTNALTDKSVALGESNISGSKGFYIKSIDTENKKIYLSKVKVDASVSTEDNTDLEFSTPAYAVGDEFSLIVIDGNEKHLHFCAKISKISNNVITYNTDIGITSLKVTTDSEFHTFMVPSKPTVGDIIIGTHAHTENRENRANGYASHVEGRGNIAAGKYAHAEGRNTRAGYAAHSEGLTTRATGMYSHTEGQKTVATGAEAHAEGSQTKASGEASHAEGYLTEAKGLGSHSEGDNTIASGDMSHAEGCVSKAYGLYSHAEGNHTTASGKGSHTEGYETTAIGDYSHAEGNYTTASGKISHAEGNYAEAIGDYSHAEGWYAKASGIYSHAEGFRTIASGNHQHVQGKYNVEDAENRYADIIGNGSASERMNIQTTDWDGNLWTKGNVYVGGKSQDEGNRLITEKQTDSKISNAISGLATKSYVDDAISNVEISGGGSGDNSQLLKMINNLHYYCNKDIIYDESLFVILSNVLSINCSNITDGKLVIPYALESYTSITVMNPENITKIIIPRGVDLVNGGNMTDEDLISIFENLQTIVRIHEDGAVLSYNIAEESMN